MSTKKAASKVLGQLYGGSLDKIRAANDQRTGQDTRQPATQKLSVYELERIKAEASRQLEHQYQAQMRARAASTVATAEAQEAQEAREQAAADEAAFKADELARYVASGGSELDFNQDWPRLRQQLIEQHYFENRTQAPGPVDTAKRVLDLYYKR